MLFGFGFVNLGKLIDFNEISTEVSPNSLMRSVKCTSEQTQRDIGESDALLRGRTFDALNS